MKNRSTFASATLCKNFPGYYNISCLDKPGWAGFFPLEGFRTVSLPPNRASFFFKKAPHHAHRNFRAQPAAHPTKTFRTPLAHPANIAHEPVKSFKAGHALAKDAGVATACPPAVFSTQNLLIGLAL